MDNKINWKQKLSSRKFWALLASLAVSIGAMFGMPEAVSVQIVALITAFGGVAVYILAEAKVDSTRSSDGESK